MSDYICISTEDFKKELKKCGLNEYKVANNNEILYYIYKFGNLDILRMNENGEMVMTLDIELSFGVNECRNPIKGQDYEEYFIPSIDRITLDFILGNIKRIAVKYKRLQMAMKKYKLMKDFT